MSVNIGGQKVAGQLSDVSFSHDGQTARTRKIGTCAPASPLCRKPSPTQHLNGPFMICLLALPFSLCPDDIAAPPSFVSPLPQLNGQQVEGQTDQLSQSLACLLGTIQPARPRTTSGRHPRRPVPPLPPTVHKKTPPPVEAQILAAAAAPT